MHTDLVYSDLLYSNDYEYAVYETRVWKGGFRIYRVKLKQKGEMEYRFWSFIWQTE